MSDLYGRDALRSLPEEFNLAVNMKPFDELSADFLRTYDIVEFRGSAMLHALEKELLVPALDRPVGKVLPVRGVGAKDRNTCPLSMVACYGWRGTAGHRSSCPLLVTMGVSYGLETNSFGTSTPVLP